MMLDALQMSHQQNVAVHGCFTFFFQDSAEFPELSGIEIDSPRIIPILLYSKLQTIEKQNPARNK